jgi:hypothetical protein
MPKRPQHAQHFNLRPIRRTQLISPFGIGSMVDFRGDESLMTAGIDAWPRANESCPSDWRVTEERLQARLGVDHFRLPPDYRRPGPRVLLANQAVPFVRFPAWHYCPRCGAMEKLSLFGSRMRCPGRQGTMCSSTAETRRRYLIPIRIVAVCPMGHIEDFPFHRWVHKGQHVDEPAHRLRFLAGRSSASLAGIKINCSCGQSRSLAGAFEFTDTGGALHRIGHDCTAGRPWLGEIDRGPEHCGQFLRVVQRGASNVYFPVVVSSIYLPLWAERTSRDVIKVLENSKYWSQLTSGLDEGKYIQDIRCELIAELCGVDKKELKAAAQRKFDGVASTENESHSEEAFRRQEYNALGGGRGGPDTELLVDLRPGSEYGRLAELIHTVGLVRKLRETRVLAGFSRLIPAADHTAPSVQPLALDLRARWCPAAVVRGEGIFLQFKEEPLRAWSQNKAVVGRIKGLLERYNSRRVERGLPSRNVDATFVLLHTFAHALISELSFECGYGSASLRERLYWNDENSRERMHGLLIYTASGDSEGTLGGLVRQGDPARLPLSVLSALRKSQWCSSDPVCIESTGQGIDNANLAACHGCVLLPETSCEEGNRLLDRAMLIGRPTSPRTGLFSATLSD